MMTNVLCIIELELFGNDHLHRHCQVLVIIKAKPNLLLIVEGLSFREIEQIREMRCFIDKDSYVV